MCTWNLEKGGKGKAGNRRDLLTLTLLLQFFFFSQFCLHSFLGFSRWYFHATVMSCNSTLSQITGCHKACFRYLLLVISMWPIIRKSRINVLILDNKYFSLWSFSSHFHITSQLNGKLFGRMLLVFAYRNSWRVCAFFKFHKPTLDWFVFIFLKRALLNVCFPIIEK